jgi:large subunit ribosomal protein L25
MAEITLVAEPRVTGRHATRTLRGAEEVPGIVYGAGFETLPIAVNMRALRKALVAAGAGLIALQIGDGQPVHVVAREVQHHPVKHRPLHVDFQAVSMTERMKLDVPIVTEGVAPALAHSGVVMNRNLDSVEIECLPQDIPQHIVANLTGMVDDHATLCVKDLIVPPGVTILTDPNHVVYALSVSNQAEEEVVAEGAAAEPEVLTKGKKEEEE